MHVLNLVLSVEQTNMKASIRNVSRQDVRKELEVSPFYVKLRGSDRNANLITQRRPELQASSNYSNSSCTAPGYVEA